MKLRRVVTVSVSEALARQRATTYFTQSGYQHVNGGALVTLKRGSIRGTLFSLSPLAWDSTVTLGFEPEGTRLKIVAELQLREVGRFLLPWNKAYWTGLLEALESALTDGAPVASKLRDLGLKSTLLNTVFGLAAGGLAGAGIILLFWTIPLAIERVTGLRAVDVMAMLAAVLLALSLVALHKLNKRIRNKIGQQ